MKGGAAALAFAPSLALSRAGFAQQNPAENVVPFLDVEPSVRQPMLDWQALENWITPTDDLFVVSHYGVQQIDAGTWRLEIGGLVEKPAALTLDDIKARPRVEYVRTIECAGNDGVKGFAGAVGNPRWAGTPLAPILRDCGLGKNALEVVFFGADKGEEELRGAKYEEHFSRSLPVKDALLGDVMLLYEMNGEPLAPEHGAPVRLGVPGWYGVAWVKWLTRIEVWDRRYNGRFMSRDYVTIRGEKRGDETLWRETLVGLMNVKSVVARVVKQPGGALLVSGAAWSNGAPIKTVELKIDDGTWRETRIIEGAEAPNAWKFWQYRLKDIQPGEHALVSRATDEDGNVQPAPDDPFITMKKTYWESNQQVPRRIKI